MSNETLRADLRAAIDELVEARINESWAGAGRPEDRPELEADARKAQARVDFMLSQI